VRDDLLARHDQLQTEHESLYLTMFEEIGKDTLDQKRLNSEIEKKIIKMQAAVPQVVSRLAELHATLTTEQKKMLVQMIRKNHKTSQR
jgi:hypothetical protein